MERRELGNPPGKTSNPVGDQLTWEQVLSNFRGKRRLWVISRDGDYGTTHGKNSFFNSFLYDELNNISPNPEVYLFQETAKGIQHFVESTGVTASNPLTAEEAEKLAGKNGP